jgi:RNA polymerase subunit RPABC4/transcription elongation factor Spt4
MSGNSTDSKETVRCNNCKTVLDEAQNTPPDKRTPCPVCGSTSRQFDHIGAVSVGVSTVHRVKAKHSNGKDPFLEQRSGGDLWRKTGENMDRSVTIDREHNLYKEVIKDPRTGKIVHSRIETLSQHFRHGDAKHKKEPKQSR